MINQNWWKWPLFKGRNPCSALLWTTAALPVSVSYWRHRRRLLLIQTGFVIASPSHRHTDTLRPTWLISQPSFAISWSDPAMSAFSNSNNEESDPSSGFTSSSCRDFYLFFSGRKEIKPSGGKNTHFGHHGGSRRGRMSHQSVFHLLLWSPILHLL